MRLSTLESCATAIRSGLFGVRCLWFVTANGAWNAANLWWKAVQNEIRWSISADTVLGVQGQQLWQDSSACDAGDQCHTNVSECDSRTCKHDALCGWQSLCLWGSCEVTQS